MSSEKSAQQFFELNIKYSRMLEQAGDRVIMHGEDAVLYWLYAENRPLLSGEISGLMELSSGRTANILHSLEKKGLILREKNSPDRRQVSVRLTKEGEEQIKSRYAESICWYQALLDRLDEQDAEAFLRFAKQMLQCAD